jgi:peptide-methionine (S)-S-oxide reductase
MLPLPIRSACLFLLAACGGVAGPDTTIQVPAMTATPKPAPAAAETATFGAGCFWCVEAVLEQVAGVQAVASGYMGGTVDNPTYKQVCTGETGHAEVVQVTFDPGQVTYAELLRWFWRLHDPTTRNRQGADVGTQYRSAIYWHSEAQRQEAERSKAEAQAAFDQPIVTEITQADRFWPAEDYHQDYYRQNSGQGYCRAVIAPKLDKLGLRK